MAEPKVRMTFDQLTANLIEDALAYYLMSTQADGPDDHSPARIRQGRSIGSDAP